MKELRKWQEYLINRTRGAESLIYGERSMSITRNGFRAMIYLEDGTFWLEVFDNQERRVLFAQEPNADSLVTTMSKFLTA